MDYKNRKMVANYHTHTTLCGHAKGTMREYVETAIDRGLETLGFACHAPQPFPGDYYSDFRMKREQQEQYVSEILKLRDEYRDRIEILIGYEAEYYPKLFGDLLDMLNRYPCDYIIMGQHYIHNEYDGTHIWATKDIEIVRQLARQTCEGMRLGVYSYFAHPDMLTYEGDQEEYLEVMEDICKTSIETDTPLELNMLGLRAHRDYPKNGFFKMAGEYGCKVIVGCDAHEPDGVCDPDTWRRAMEMAERHGLNLLDRVPLRRPVLA